MTPRLTHKFKPNGYSERSSGKLLQHFVIFFASTKIGISHENLEKIFTKTYRKAVPWTYKIVLIMFVRGKV